MKHRIGFLLQLFVLSALPLLVVYQLRYGFRLIMMPACLLAGTMIFAVGTWLRES